MEQLVPYIVLLTIIVIVGQLFSKSAQPISLLLVLVGMLFSFIPDLPTMKLNPDLVLYVFLPLLLYQISTFSSWKDVKKNIRPIALLSVGHVIFITILVAIVIHTLIPELGWPLAFVVGAIISPPDDVAIVAIAEKIRMPDRIVTILEGEGLLNDATALILFRFALVAAITHQFSLFQAVYSFIFVIVGETLYGLALGHFMGQLRLRIHNNMLHIIASFLTPFLAYLPAEMLGGSGVLATVVTGFVIGNFYAIRFTPDFRLVSRAIWPALAFAIQSILFLLIGLNMKSILENISSLSPYSLLLYGSAMMATVIIGRFIWVYGALIYLPRLLFPSIRKRDPYPPWQYPFVISWAGLRGAISLAAALAIPTLPAVMEGVHTKALIIFLVFCVIAATLVLQGLTLSSLLKVIGMNKYGQREKYNEHVAEIYAQLQMTKAVLAWLTGYKKRVRDNPQLLDEIKLHIREYKMLKKQLKAKLLRHDGEHTQDDTEEHIEETFLLSQIIEVERAKLIDLWRDEKINLSTRNRLLDKLDHRSKHISA